MKKLCLFAVAVSLLSTVHNGHCQNTLQFTSVNATPEGAIQLHWAGNSNEIYEIDYATSLIDTNTGATTWNRLYTDYPSHGTNTFWLDTGDYFVSPAISHPKNDSMRFYRIVTIRTDTAENEPTISITSPSDGATVSNTITVSVSAGSSDVIAEVKLYVDGQEMSPSFNGTNFVINTCEWWNGQHTLFATAKSVSHYEGIANDASVTYGHAVSSYVNLTFNNLISKIAFSQPYFEPSLGQIQEVTASFAANCNWTLQIQDINSNAVRHANGSGMSMVFDWNGTGDGGTNIPDGVYTYQITAQTNGIAFSSMSLENSAMSISAIPDNLITEPYVIDDSGNMLPLAIYPPGFDTNGLLIVDATAADVQSLRPTLLASASASPKLMGSFALSANNASADDASATASNETTTAPLRPPTARGIGTKGTFYVGYNDYIISSGSFQTPPIRTGWPWPVSPQYVALDGRSQSQASQSETWGSIYEHTALANGFAYVMQNGRWRGSVNRNITSSDVTGGIFNQANVGLLCVHGSYGTTAEIDGVKHSYLRFGQFSPTYCRLDDCSFGASTTNGLKFMAILSCNALNNVDYNSMYNYGRLPINSDLHLLLGTSTVATAAPSLGARWALRLIGDGTTNHPVERVSTSWPNAGSETYNLPYPFGETNHITIVFRVAGWPDAFSEYVTDVDKSPSTGNPLDITHSDTTVYSF